MILAETTVAIRYLRTPTTRLQKIIQDQQAAICGVTLAEVFAGAKKATDLAQFSTSLGIFGVVPIPLNIWDDLGRNLFLLRKSGFVLPFPDVLLATVAIHHDLELWTYDAHFPLIQSVLTNLRLFQEPP